MYIICEGHLGGYVQGGDYRTWTPEIWEYLVTANNVSSVLDVGAGEGHSTKWFLDRGLDATAIDGSLCAELGTQVPGRHVKHDFETGPWDPGRRYDMIWCCEFLEHVDEKFLPNVLETFKSADLLALTAALPGQDGHNHVNCQPLEYWIDALAGAGFRIDVESTKATRAMASSEHFYKHTGMIYRAADAVFGV